MGRNDTQNSLLDHALAHAAVGLPVLPLRPRDKRPVFKGGYSTATTDPAQIRAWWAENPEFNIGIPTGLLSGVVVLDVDGRSFQGFTLPETITAISGGEGYRRHHLFAVEQEFRTLHLEGICLLGEGALIVASGSVHPETGRVYRWAPGHAPGECEFAPFPAGLYEYLQRLPRKKRTREGGTRTEGKKREKPPRKTIKDHFPCLYTGFAFPEYARDENFILEVMRRCGARPEKLGIPFICPIHPWEKNASASLWRPANEPLGFIGFRHWHDDPLWLLPSNVWAHIHFGVPLKPRPAQSALWWIRCVHKIGGAPLPEIPHRPLPKDAPQEARIVYEGFILSARCHEKYKANQDSGWVPFAEDFAVIWCGSKAAPLKKYHIQKGLAYLVGQGFLEREIRPHKNKKKLGHYRPLIRGGGES